MYLAVIPISYVIVIFSDSWGYFEAWKMQYVWFEVVEHFPYYFTVIL
jgi:hypothetical protein